MSCRTNQCGAFRSMETNLQHAPWQRQLRDPLSAVLIKQRATGNGARAQGRQVPDLQRRADAQREDVQGGHPGGVLPFPRTPFSRFPVVADVVILPFRVAGLTGSGKSAGTFRLSGCTACGLTHQRLFNPRDGGCGAGPLQISFANLALVENHRMGLANTSRGATSSVGSQR